MRIAPLSKFAAVFALSGMDVIFAAGGADKAAVMQQAQSLVQDGKVDAAVSALANETLATKNSPAANLEIAQRLSQVAAMEARKGRPSNARTVALRALGHLDLCYRESRTPATRASAAQLSGHLYERYLGDINSAKSSYRAAVAADDRSVQAKESLARLESR
jgi:hypothetical protein